MKDSPRSSRPVSRMVTCVVVATVIEQSPHKSVWKWSATFDYVWPQEGPGNEVILASVCNWALWYWHVTILQSMCFVVGMISGSLVSWERSLFRWMCSLLQLPILKCFLGLNRFLIICLRCKTTHHRLWWCRCNCQSYHWPVFLWWNC